MPASVLSKVTRVRVVKPPRMVILGVEKVGKSTFAAGCPKVVFIPIKLEEGIDDLPCDKLPVAKTFDQVRKYLKALLEEDHDYEAVALDSASTFEALIWEHVCKLGGVKSIEKYDGGFGKGYVEALNQMRLVMEDLTRLRDEKGMASIIIGHVKVKRFDDPERESYDQYQFDINDKIANALLRWADFIGFANKKIEVAQENVGFRKTKAKAIDSDTETHYLFTKKTPAHPGGGRGVYGELPDEIPLSWEEFVNAVGDALAEREPKPAKKKISKK